VNRCGCNTASLLISLLHTLLLIAHLFVNTDVFMLCLFCCNTGDTEKQMEMDKLIDGKKESERKLKAECDEAQEKLGNEITAKLVLEDETEKKQVELDNVKEELQSAQEKVSDDVSPKAALEDALQKKQEELDKLKEELQSTQGKLRSEVKEKAALEDETKKKQVELDKVKEELQSAQKKVSDDVSLKAALEDDDSTLVAEHEHKLKKKQDELDSLKVKYEDSEKLLRQERDDLQNKVTQLKLERKEADLRAKDDLQNVNIELARNEVHLQYAKQAIDELKSLSKERMSEPMKLVEATTRLDCMTKENAELRRKHDEVYGMLLRESLDGRGASIELHSGIHRV